VDVTDLIELALESKLVRRAFAVAIVLLAYVGRDQLVDVIRYVGMLKAAELHNAVQSLLDEPVRTSAATK
jgi:hypothetical protein